MDWKARIRAALQDANARLVLDDDVVEELAQHAAAIHDAAVARGASRDEAIRKVDEVIARWRVEAPTLRRRLKRQPAVDPPAAGARLFAGLIQDVRYALRLLARQRRFSLIAIATMALGVGTTTVLFSVTYGVLLKPLPWPAGARLVQLDETRGGNPPRFGSFSNAALATWQADPKTIAAIAGWSQRTATLFDGTESERVPIAQVSPNLFQMLGVPPRAGALLDPSDDAARTVVLSERLWQRRFGADPEVAGRSVQLDGVSYQIRGVLAGEHAFPSNGIQAWIPFSIPSPAGNLLSMFQAIALLQPGASAEQAAAEGTARARNAVDSGMTTVAIFGKNGPIQITARPLREAMTADVRRPLVMLLAAVVLLFLAATANLAGLQITRATARTREMAIRAALGAGRGRVARQLLVEALLLGATGGAAGLGIAALLHRAVPSILPPDFPRVDSVTVDGTVIAFAIGVSLVTSVICGLWPARGIRRASLVPALVEDGTSPAGIGARTRAGRARMVLISGQVAIACILLVGASLIGRSFLSLVAADRGYEAAGVLSARVSFPAALYAPARRYELADRILSAIAANDGVVAAAFNSEGPTSPGGSTASFTLPPSRPDAEPVSVQASPRLVSAAYFSTMHTPIVAGRGFDESDVLGAPPVAIVNRAFARRYLGDAAIGAKVPMALGYEQTDQQATVVGVVEDARYVTSAEQSRPELYYCYRQLSGKLTIPGVTLLVRTTGPPASFAATMQGVVRSADAQLKAEAVLPLDERLMQTLARPRLYAVLFVGCATLALLVCGVGLFSVLSYAVAQRTREIAVRAALGAKPRGLIWLVVKQGLALTGLGIVVGLGAAAALVRFASTFLYGLTPYDPATFVAVPIVILAAAVLACWAPALRASRLNPSRLLR
jgi:predicted permease